MPHPSPRFHSPSHPGLVKKLAIVLSLLLLLAACSRSRPPQLDTPTPAPEGATLLGQLEVTFTVDPQSLRRSPPALFPASPHKVWSADSPPRTCPTASIDKEGFRYLYGTYRVTNNGGALSNLSFYAMNTSDAVLAAPRSRTCATPRAKRSPPPPSRAPLPPRTAWRTTAVALTS